jgi:SSS family transporter
MKAGFSALDYSILVFYVLGSVTLGLWFARKQNSVEGYYLAERSAPWWAVAISLISSDLTAISYMGCAALVFTSDLQISLGALMMPAAALFVAYIFVPFMARLRLFTVYEYLEHRFNVGVRTVASVLFMLTRSSHLSVALYAASLALSEMVGLNVWFSLLIMGGLTTLYTVFGGMKAVLWTDVAQFFVLMGGLVAVLVGVAMAFHWDVGMIWRIASNPPNIHAPWLAHGASNAVSHTRFFNFGTSFFQMTFWIIMIYGFLAVIGSYGSDQVLVQRYLAAGSKAQMAKSLVAGGLITLPMNILMYSSGIFLVAYYNHFLNVPGHEWVSGLTDPNRVMPHFVSHGIPGVLGAIVIAGLFAGTMASLSAGLNSLSTVSYIDVWKRFGKGKAESAKKGVARAKLITLGWGIVIVFGAKLVGGQDTILAILNKVMSPFAGPLLGMFLLGMLSKRANTFGVIAGVIFGAGATIFVTYVLKIHWLWYFVVGSMGTLVSGYIFSLLAPAPDTEETGHLTYAGSRALAEEAIPAGTENA